MTRPNRLWLFFNRRQSSALCYTCDKEISLGHFLPKHQTTSNVKRHLRKCHQNEWEQYTQSQDVPDIAKRRKLEDVPETKHKDVEPKPETIPREDERYDRQRTISPPIDYPDLYEEQIDLDQTKDHINVNPFSSIGMTASTETLVKLQEKKLKAEIYYMEKKGDLEIKNLSIKHSLMLLKAKKIRLEIEKMQREI